MAHIRYGDRNYKIPQGDFEGTQDVIMKTLEADSAIALTIREVIDGEEYPTTVFVSRGVPISVHGWDTTHL